MTDGINDQPEAADQALVAAMISNDPDAIRRCITDGWVLVTPERGPG